MIIECIIGNGLARKIGLISYRSCIGDGPLWIPAATISEHRGKLRFMIGYMDQGNYVCVMETFNDVSYDEVLGILGLKVIENDRINGIEVNFLDGVLMNNIAKAKGRTCYMFPRVEGDKWWPFHVEGVTFEEVNAIRQFLF